MRPIPGDDAFGRPRAATDNDTPSAFQHHAAPPMTYVLADESTVDISLQQSSSVFQRSRESRKAHAHEPSETGSCCLSSHTAIDKDTKEGRPSSSKGSPEALRHEGSSIPGPGPGSPAFRPPSSANLSQPMTPSLIGISGPASALSSVSSRRNSLSGSLLEDMESQALSMDCEADKEPSQSMMDSGSAPQLIMPSIKMPSRRPFTDAGKVMGRLKVLVAGDSGIGKTSLIKAIVQSCEHIVHVDPIAPSPVSLAHRTASPRRGGRKHSTKQDPGTSQITEIFASTKPYPEWWSDLDDFRILKRRKSLGDTVLDRNICFVDTPGYGNGSSAMETISLVVHYVESHLQRMSSNTLADEDMLNMLGGDGGVQVDIVFYMISNRLKPVDIEYLRRLTPLTNVIPLLAQADLLTPAQVAACKEQIDGQLREANIRPFSFMVTSPTMAPHTPQQCPYSISSATGSDHDIMDASLLMSPDYVQPLITSELTALVEQVFSQDGASWLRYSAARKYLQWRKAESPSKPMALYQPLSLASSYARTTASQILTPPMGATSSFALARVTDHTQREERLAQIRLANWASDLQKSLTNERARYEALARGERAIWLTERLNECVHDGTLVPVSSSGSGRNGRNLSRVRGKARRKFGSDRCSSSKSLQQHQDPLGLLEVVEDLRHKGIIALEVLGSLGVLGGLALWLTKHYWHLQAYQWLLSEWDKFWYGVR